MRDATRGLGQRRRRLRAASWEGVISIDELPALGVPERTAYRRTQEDGPWTLLAPATFLLSNGAPTYRQLEIAALIYAGEGAMITGLGGARHHGVRRGDEPTTVHVLIAESRRMLSTTTSSSSAPGVFRGPPSATASPSRRSSAASPTAFVG